MIRTKWTKSLVILSGLLLVLASLGPAQPLAFQVGVRAQPVLMQLAASQPERAVRVIVQKTGEGSGAEQQVAHLGGNVTATLDLIHAFAAEMTASDAVQLASSPFVRWVSLDAPMYSASTADTSVAWATTVGTVIQNQFTDPLNIVDGSGLGPNGTYGYRFGNGKGTFSGFTVETVPGNAVKTVEAVFYAYANSSFSHDLKIKVYLNGAAQKDVTVKTTVFSQVVGAQNAGLVAVDITAATNWNWSDFYNNLELYVEQGGFAGGQALYFDAIGLRVTSAPGVDNSADALADPTLADTTVDGSQQVNVYNQVIGASQLWNTADRLQGKGVAVAVVDSGIFKTDDLKGRVKANVNFNPSYHDGSDRYGHGTFVAGIIAGNGKKSGGQYIGVAPKATLLNVRISDDQGMVYESDVIDSLQWVAANKDKYNIRVVNLSLNSSVSQPYDTSPLDAACEILWFNGMVVVVSAGNNGTSTLFPPANDPFVITVGATEDKGTVKTSDDVTASFSAWGVTEDGFPKPDLVAPGRLIIGLLPENNRLSMGQSHPGNRVNTTYFKMSGTSVSSPIVSGAVALLLQDQPSLTPDQVKYRLMSTAHKQWPGYDPTTAGAGYLNIYDAVYATTTASANTGIPVSNLLTTGPNGVTKSSVNWNSVNWNSVNWNSVNWNSVNWNSVNWNSVNWNSDYWEP